MWQLVFLSYTGDHVDQQGDIAYFTLQNVSLTPATSVLCSKRLGIEFCRTLRSFVFWDLNQLRIRQPHVIFCPVYSQGTLALDNRIIICQEFHSTLSGTPSAYADLSWYESEARYVWQQGSSCILERAVRTEVLPFGQRRNNSPRICSQVSFLRQQ